MSIKIKNAFEGRLPNTLSPQVSPPLSPGEISLALNDDVYESQGIQDSLLDQGIEKNLQALKRRVAHAFRISPFAKEGYSLKDTRRKALEDISGILDKYPEQVKVTIAKRYVDSQDISEQIIGMMSAGRLTNQNERNKQYLLSQYYFGGPPLLKALTIQTIAKCIKTEGIRAELLGAFAECEDRLELRRLLVTQAGSLHKFRNKIDFLKFFLTDLEPSIVETAKTQLNTLERHIPLVLPKLQEAFKREHLKETQEILSGVLQEYREFVEDQRNFFELKNLMVNAKELSPDTLETIQATRKAILDRLKHKNNQKKYPLIHRFLQKIMPEIRGFKDQVKEASDSINIKKT